MIKNHKDKVEDQSEFLMDDRGAIGKMKKYENSLSKFVGQARGLEQELKGI